MTAPAISEKQMIKETGAMVERVVGFMTGEFGRKALREGFKQMILTGAIPTMKVIEAARDGHEDADLALREMIIEMINRHEELPTELAAYNIEALMRAPAAYPGGRNLANTWTRDIGIAILVEIVAARWDLPLSRNPASNKPCAASVVTAALGSRLKPPIGEAAVVKIHREHDQMVDRLKASAPHLSA